MPITLSKLLLKENINSILLIEDIQDFINIGRISRLSFSFKIDGIIILRNNPVNISTSIERLSTGLISLIPIIFIKNMRTCMQTLRSHNFSIIGTSLKGDKNIKNHIFSFPTILFVGNEYRGLSSMLKRHCINIIFISSSYSINIADAIAIFLYEIYTQLIKKD